MTVRLTLSLLALSAVGACCSAPLGLQSCLDAPLPAFPPGALVRLKATTGMEGQGQDYKLIQPGESAVVLTIPGPAVIHRVWSTSQYTEATRLVVAVDGAKRVLWERGKLPPGQKADDPLRAMDGQAYWSYVPIAVKREAKFLATDLREKADAAGDPEQTGNKFYLQVAYTPGGEGSVTDAAVDEVRERLRMVASDPLAGSAPIVSHGNEQVPKTETLTLTAETPVRLRDGENTVIEALMFDVQGASFDQLKSTRLVIKTDGSRDACVDVPLPYLFCAYWGLDEYSAPYTAVKGGKLVFRLPIPEGKGLELGLARYGGSPGLESLAVTVVRGIWSDPPPYRFCAEYRSIISERGEPLRLADIIGEGVFVGCTFAAGARLHRKFAFLEGNEQIYVDGDEKPTWEGTGTEDFFNSAWYFSGGVHARAFHGLVHLDEGPPPRMAAYRLLIPDRIAFSRSLRFEMQHGSRNSVPDIEYRCVSLWYQKPPCKVAEPREAVAKTGGDSPGGGEDPEESGTDLVTPIVLAVIVVLAAIAGVRYLLRSRT